MGVFFELPHDGIDHARMALPGIQNGDPAGEVNVAPSFNVPDFRVLTAFGKN